MSASALWIFHIAPNRSQLRPIRLDAAQIWRPVAEHRGPCRHARPERRFPALSVLDGGFEPLGRAPEDGCLVSVRNLARAHADAAFDDEILIGSDQDEVFHPVAPDEDQTAHIIDVVELADAEPLPKAGPRATAARARQDEDDEQNDDRRKRRAGVEADVGYFHHGADRFVPNQNWSGV